jgi:hypothetical protein
MTTIKKIFGIKDTPIQKFVQPDRQSIEQTEDYAVKKVLQTREAYIGTLPTDNSTVDVAYVPMVLYNTDATPPAASNFPIGTIYIQYTP